MEDYKMRTYTAHKILLGLVLITVALLTPASLKAQMVQPTLLTYQVNQKHHNVIMVNYHERSARLLSQVENTLEKWMTDLASWNLKTETSTPEPENFSAEKTIVEDWMTNPASWDTEADMESERDYGFETWMAVPFETVKEDAVLVEDWMLTTATWGKKI